MKRCLLIGLVVAYPALALAQVAPKVQPEFVPFTVDKKGRDAIAQWLLDQPAKFSIPVFNWLDDMEQQSVKATAKKDPDKKEP